MIELGELHGNEAIHIVSEGQYWKKDGNADEEFENEISQSRTLGKTLDELFWEE